MPHTEINKYIQEMFFHGRPDEVLLSVEQILIRFWSEDIPLRLSEDIAAYTEEMIHKGSTGIVDEIYHVLGEKRVGFVDNKFPYSHVAECLPPGHRFNHFCLWSRTGPLSREEIDGYIGDQFPDHPALVFVNGDNHKTIPELWHAHVIIIESEI